MTWRTVAHWGVLAAILVAPSCRRDASPSAPPVFGGQGATIEGPDAIPLPPEEPEAKGPCGDPPPTERALIDDFEDGDGKIFKAFQREGWWYTATDATEGGTVHPARGTFAADPLGEAEATSDNGYAAHLSAEGYQDWGVTWGTTLRWVDQGIRCPLDASGFSGIRFRARGTGRLRVNFGIPPTIPKEDGGRCEDRCYDMHGKIVRLKPQWQWFTIPWDRVQQDGWGTQARFDQGRLLSLAFAAKPDALPVDVWIDDIEFIEAKAWGPPAGQR